MRILDYMEEETEKETNDKYQDGTKNKDPLS